MKVLIDISHPAHLNLFKSVVYKLSENKEEILVTILDRGKLYAIVEKELNGVDKVKIAKHQGNFFSIIFEANILKIFSLIKLFFKIKPDICISAGSFTCGFVCKIFRIPNIQFSDDPERKLNFILEKLTSTELFFPPIIAPNKKIKNFNALKEWAYLSPDYFTPDINVLKEYKLKEKEYIFVREVDTGSLNYQKQQKNIIATFANLLPESYKVLLSLEKKDTVNLYPSNWIILKEPVLDIHSLMYFSKLIISSGDSMAREGGMLGVPSIYCGYREMKANEILINKKILYHVDYLEVPDFVINIFDHKMTIPDQRELRNNLLKEWDDVSKFILKTIYKY